MSKIVRISRDFWRRERGATAVEFAILMPIMMVCFGAVVEGARIYWNYQSAVSGVRDASRYLARITDTSICGGTANANYVALPGGQARAQSIIQRNVGTGAANLFPTAVTVNEVSARYACPNLSLRTNPTPLVWVEATLTVQLPFGAVFEFFGARSNTQVTSVIADYSRIYGS